MLQRAKVLRIVGTLGIAFATGHFMQYGGAIAAKFSGDDTEGAMMTPSFQSGLPLAPLAVLNIQPVPSAPVRVAALDLPTAKPMLSDAVGYTPFDIACELSANALTETAAMVSLVVHAPCGQNQRALIQHAGIEFTLLADEYGDLSVSIPALERHAEFRISFSDGNEAVVQTEVFTVDAYMRTVLAFEGNTGLALNAFENGAEYFEQGHVTTAQTPDPQAAVTSQTGFMTLLGEDTGLHAKYAHIYSYPADALDDDTAVRLLVEAEITEQNCGKPIVGKAIQTIRDEQSSEVDLTLTMPECDAIGTFLLLKNFVQDLTLAQN